MGRSSNEPGEIEKTPAYSISLSEPERQCGRAKTESKNQSARSRSMLTCHVTKPLSLWGPCFHLYNGEDGVQEHLHLKMH